MLAPPVTRTLGVSANVTDGSTVRRSRYGSGMPGSTASASSVGSFQVWLKSEISMRAPSRSLASFRLSKPKRKPGVLLDQVVVVVERKTGDDPVIAVAHRDVEHAAPALVRVVDELRPRGREGNPPRALFLAELEDDADAPALAAARDAPRDVVPGPLGLEPLVQLLGLIVIEPPADQRLQPVAQRLTDLAVGNALNLHALDDVARVDVLGEAVIVADAGDEKDDACLAVRSRDRAHGRHDVGILAFDPLGKLAEALAVQRLARQRVDLAAKARTQGVAAQPRDVNRFNDGPLRGLDVLGVGRRRRHAEGEDEEEQ